MENDLLSAQEVADILKIARNTVYELIKRGELSSSKVGKQVRVDRQEVEAYLTRTKSVDSKKLLLSTQQTARATVTQTFNQTLEEGPRMNELIICGQDLSLDILANHLNTMSDTLQIFRSFMGSYNGIYALYQGRVNVATAHLWDGDTNQYNSTYVKKMMPGIPARIIRIGKRQQGFYVQKNNPKGITGWADLKRNDITIVNREKGSGTRVLLDEKLRLMGLIGDYIEGYFRECKSHLAVATTISRGGADVAIGSETGCKNIPGIEFIPLQTECYDLIIRLADAEKQPYRMILEILSSEAFRMDLESIGGFDTEETGKIIPI
ncbi:helix-turn-helix transcriptional regulator [Anaerocolumna sp. AGMB13025]|uniref:helix-turn-helix transcriptional regulator n=1 Tax=Anaerocolumna sp. AGMB13025 TaxID=3039116 RepID=UPI00241D6C16|nr:helix-turn-helix transcriptional regulator [Anaerocolumna sp. AGMB13025]WFR58742.1 helix-turn-helix transcriptional regulator [Anaerocolumna sp. AGMB13025]